MTVAIDQELASELVAALGLFRRQLRRATGRPFPTGSLTGAQVDLVRLVRDRPGVSIAEAANELGVAANTVSTLVGQLSELDVLERTADGRDRRVARLALKPAARERLTVWRDGRVSLLGDALAGLDKDQKALLRKAIPVLNELVRNLHEVAP